MTDGKSDFTTKDTKSTKKCSDLSSPCHIGELSPAPTVGIELLAVLGG